MLVVNNPVVFSLWKFSIIFHYCVRCTVSVQCTLYWVCTVRIHDVMSHDWYNLTFWRCHYAFVELSNVFFGRRVYFLHYYYYSFYECAATQNKEKMNTMKPEKLQAHKTYLHQRHSHTHTKHECWMLWARAKGKLSKLNQMIVIREYFHVNKLVEMAFECLTTLRDWWIRFYICFFCLVFIFWCFAAMSLNWWF